MARGSHHDVDHVWGVDMLTKNEQYGQFCCLKETLTVRVGCGGMCIIDKLRTAASLQIHANSPIKRPNSEMDVELQPNTTTVGASGNPG